ncbi:hypothetical protein EV643_111243 [Kribbella sp. VKM Ac-2527]|uniref:EthD domain-containing protein n=1 Tax=Kribbella caucasensis TaxID=2512215 RepID=A0A4R6KCA8_9ACTN|nr:DUF4286 family protein [Kribbella sp. VKM Ac-2527]TDO46390.1 hypothetical protein EV643_111243 [Kribbella sp. VKM Ac-2527]
MPDDTPHQAVMVTFSAPADGDTDEAFNDWYENQHVPELLEHVDGITAVHRYRLAETQPPSPGGPLPYLAIYELDRPPAVVLANLAAAHPKLTPSETLGPSPITYLYSRLSTHGSISLNRRMRG